MTSANGGGGGPSEVTRRRFLGYLIAGPTLVAAAPILKASNAFAALGDTVPTAQVTISSPIA